MTEFPNSEAAKESIQGPLSALRSAGTVCGVCLARELEILVNLFPFAEARVSDMVLAMDDIQSFFRKKGRKVDQMSFGYDGGCVTFVEDGGYRLVVMHMLPDEVDFIAKAARAFLADFQLGLFAEQIAAGNQRLTGLVSGAQAPAVLKPAAEGHSTGPMERLAPQSAVIPRRSGDRPAEAARQPASRKVAEAPADAPADAPAADPDWVPELKELPGPPAGAVSLSADQPGSTQPPPRRPKGR